MRKYIALLLTAVMLFSLAACSGASESTDGQANQQSAPAEDTAATASTEKPTEAPTEPSTEAPTEPADPVAEAIQAMTDVTYGRNMFDEYLTAISERYNTMTIEESTTPFDAPDTLVVAGYQFVTDIDGIVFREYIQKYAQYMTCEGKRLEDHYYQGFDQYNHRNSSMQTVDHITDVFDAPENFATPVFYTPDGGEYSFYRFNPQCLSTLTILLEYHGEDAGVKVERTLDGDTFTLVVDLREADGDYSPDIYRVTFKPDGIDCETVTTGYPFMEAEGSDFRRMERITFSNRTADTMKELGGIYETAEDSKDALDKLGYAFD